MRPIVNVLEEDRATAIGNMHKNLIAKDRAWGPGDILSDRQTQRQTHTSQYFATALAGGVTRNSSGDEIANVNFSTTTCSTSFTQCAPEVTEFCEITENKGYYAV